MLPVSSWAETLISQSERRSFPACTARALSRSVRLKFSTIDLSGREERSSVYRLSLTISNISPVTLIPSSDSFRMYSVNAKHRYQRECAVDCSPRICIGVDARREVRNRSLALSGSIHVEVVLTLDIHHELPAPSLWFLSSEAIEQISLARITV